MLNYFDSHAHYMDERFAEDRETLLPELYKGGVKYIMNVAYDMPSSKEAVSLSLKYDFCYGAVGVHPHDADSITTDDYDELKKLSSIEKIMAIGETGLDYYYDNSERNAQKKAFSEHLDLACEVNLPVIIHEREATKDTLDIILPHKNTRGVFHCFAGSVETARIVLNKGYYISFAGPVTFKNSKYVKEVAAYVPEDRFLIETDCPYLAPVPKRGERNNSLNLFYIAEAIGQLKGKSTEEIAKMSMENAKKLFGVK